MTFWEASDKFSKLPTLIKLIVLYGALAFFVAFTVWVGDLVYQRGILEALQLLVLLVFCLWFLVILVFAAYIAFIKFVLILIIWPVDLLFGIDLSDKFFSLVLPGDDKDKDKK